MRTSVWTVWSEGLRAGDTDTVNDLVERGIATTPLHYDAFLQSSPSLPWSDRTLAIYMCGPPEDDAVLSPHDTVSAEALMSINRGVLATRAALWFYRKYLSDPLMLHRVSLLHPLSHVRPCVRGGYNDIDADYVPWLVHLVSEYAWRPETAVHLLLLQLWQSDGAWTEDTRSKRDAFPSPPVLLAYFLFYFREVMPHAEASLRQWLSECTGRMDVDPVFIHDVLQWDPTVTSAALNPYHCAYFKQYLGISTPVHGWDSEQLSELVYLGSRGAAEMLGVPPPPAEASAWGSWLTSVLEDARVDEDVKWAVAMKAPASVLETLLELQTALEWTAMAYQGRCVFVDDRVLGVLDAYDDAPSQDWYDDVATRWRGTKEGLRRLLEHARAAGRVPAVWWTAVAYDDEEWQQEIFALVPLQTTSDDLLMQLGPDAVMESLKRWAQHADSAPIRASVNAWMS